MKFVFKHLKFKLKYVRFKLKIKLKYLYVTLKMFRPLCCIWVTNSQYCTYGQYFDFKIRRDNKRIFLWALRLWVSRLSQLIVGCLSKADGKRAHAKTVKFFFNSLIVAYRPQYCKHGQNFNLKIRKDYQENQFRMNIASISR